MGFRSDKVRELGEKFARNPVYFVHEVMGITPTKQQQRLFKNVATPDSHTGVKSGHGTGKTSAVAQLILWGVTVFEHVRIPVTAPSKANLQYQVWPEIYKWHARMRSPYKEMIEVTDQEVRSLLHPKRDFAVARTTRKETSEALQGFHAGQGGKVFFYVDEAAGVPDEVFIVAEGAMSEHGASFCMTSNPTRLTGFFYNTFKRKKGWTLLTFNCEDSPLVSKQWIREMEEKYGRESNIFKVRVLGEFPESEENMVFSPEIISRAEDADLEPFGDIYWGLDIAGMGDDETVLAKRVGPVITELEGRIKLEPMEVVDFVCQQYFSLPLQQRPAMIYGDIVGIGAGIISRLTQLGLPVYGVNFASRSSDRRRWTNLRSELTFLMADLMMEGKLKIPMRTKLQDQLLMIKFKPSFGQNTSALAIVGKHEMPDSTDYPDAIMLTLYAPDMVSRKFGSQDLDASMPMEITVESEYDMFNYL